MKYYIFKDREVIGAGLAVSHKCPVCNVKTVFTSHYDEATGNFCCERPSCVEAFEREVLLKQAEAEDVIRDAIGNGLPVHSFSSKNHFSSPEEAGEGEFSGDD